jgi:hypothetical protein
MKKLLIFGTGIILMASIQQLIENAKPIQEPESKVIIRYISFDTVNDSLSLDNVYNYLKCLNIKAIDTVFAQAIQETGHLKCTNCSLDYNNLFGFRYNKKYIEFDNWKQSCMYYYCWQSWKYKGGCYYEFLNNVGYAEDEEYTIRLDGILKNMVKY